MNNNKHIFFDLDHTLWDFDKNAAETLEELHTKHQILEKHNKTAKDFIDAYEIINKDLWVRYNKREITKDLLRTERFVLTFKAMGVPSAHIPSNLWEEYLEICPQKTNLMPGALEVCETLIKEYDLHIISNGFQKTQEIKLKCSGLDKYFGELITSEKFGIPKPNKEIFEEAMKITGCKAEETLMIGDNLETDIQGALNSKIEPIWFNPKGEKSNLRVKEIRKLSELISLLN